MQTDIILAPNQPPPIITHEVQEAEHLHPEYEVAESEVNQEHQELAEYQKRKVKRIVKFEDDDEEIWFTANDTSHEENQSFTTVEEAEEAQPEEEAEEAEDEEQEPAQDHHQPPNEENEAEEERMDEPLPGEDQDGTEEELDESEPGEEEGHNLAIGGEEPGYDADIENQQQDSEPNDDHQFPPMYQPRQPIFF